EAGQRDVPRVPAEPPRIAGANQLPVQAAAVREDNLAEKAPVPVSPGRKDGDRAVEREVGREPACAVTVRLALLRRVDSYQANGVGSVVVEHRDRVAIRHADDSPLELPGDGRDGEPARSNERQKRPAEGTPPRLVPRFHGTSVWLAIRSVSI